jgi:phospholipid/cholesterol/gamma-HCH transport system substrate-binding protein
MDTKINFFKIGMFIVIFTIALLGVIFWLGKYGFEKKNLMNMLYILKNQFLV